METSEGNLGNLQWETSCSSAAVGFRKLLMPSFLSFVYRMWICPARGRRFVEWCKTSNCTLHSSYHLSQAVLAFRILRLVRQTRHHLCNLSWPHPFSMQGFAQLLHVAWVAGYAFRESTKVPSWTLRAEETAHLRWEMRNNMKDPGTKWRSVKVTR